MQVHSSSVKSSKSVFSFDVEVYDLYGPIEEKVPVECSDLYHEVFVINNGGNSSYPVKFKHRFVILTAKHLFGTIDAREVDGQELTTVFLAPYEILKEVKLSEQRTVLPGKTTSRLDLVLTLITESTNDPEDENTNRSSSFVIAKVDPKKPH